MKNLDLSIIILNFNTIDLTVSCVESIFKHAQNINFELLIVDNGSTDSSLLNLRTLAKKYNQIRLIVSKENLGFAAGNNLAMKKARGRFTLLLNSDTFITQNIFKPILLWLEDNPKAGIVTCELKNKDGSHQANGGYFPNLFNVFAWMFFLDDIPLLNTLIKPFHSKSMYNEPTKQDWVTGAFILIRRACIEQIGYLDSKFFMYVEDMEYCYRAQKANWQIWVLPKYSIVHLGGASSHRLYPIIMEFKNQLQFYKKYYPTWQYPIFYLIFKIGSLIRIPLFTILKGKEVGYAYIKAFEQI